MVTTSTVSNVSKEADHVAEKAKSGVAGLKDSISETASNVASTARAKVSDAAGSLQDTVGQVKQAAVDGATSIAEQATSKLKSVGVDTDALAAQAKDSAGALQKAIEDEARSHPLRTIGIAAVAGLVLGALFTR